MPLIVKTITCHDVYNVGASLQAYALMTYLKGLGTDVEIIDYKPDYLSHHFSLWGLNNPAYDKPVIRELYNLAKLPGRLKNYFGRQKKEFDDFASKYLVKTGRRFISNDDLKDNLPKADVYFAGSDQIWNCFFQNGKDPSFYLDFAPDDAVKASYAASFATEDVPDKYKLQVKKWLSRLDAISVREKSGAEIIKKLGIDGVTCVLDPVFLLTKEDWKKLAQPLPYCEKFILLYDFDNNEELGKAVRKLADEKGFKVYSYLPNAYADQCFNKYGPLTFLSLVKDAEIIMSNSFHATAFSLIFEKNFWVVNRQEAINTRMRDLTEAAGVPERLITDYNRDLCAEIVYDKVRNALIDQIEMSRVYIREVLRRAEK